jgi:hypothetical protein
MRNLHNCKAFAVGLSKVCWEDATSGMVKRRLALLKGVGDNAQDRKLFLSNLSSALRLLHAAKGAPATLANIAMAISVIDHMQTRV